MNGVLGTQFWYSKNKRQNQKLFVRLHKFELFTDYPSKVNWSQVDGLIFIAPKMLDTGVTKFSLETNVGLIYNCINTNSFELEKKEGSEFNLGLLGYLPQIKRIDLAFDVLLKLREKDQRYKLLVKGKHPSELSWVWNNLDEKAYYEKVFQRLEDPILRNNVIFDGYSQDVQKWFQQVGYILSVSDVEGSHQAVAEGMASGAIPFISGGFYHDYGASLIYPQRYCCPSILDIVQRVDILNCNKSLRQTLQKEVKDYAKNNFDIQIISSQMGCFIVRQTFFIQYQFDPCRQRLYQDFTIC